MRSAVSAVSESVFTLSCHGDALLSIHHDIGRQDGVLPTLGVVMIVGGMQYRAGAHRLYVEVARHLAAGGVPVLRFDCRGLGDSSGEWRGFEHIGDDIHAAISALMTLHNNLSGVVLWGLCDGASAAVLSAVKESTVKGLILVNPWLDSQQSKARVMLRYYYRRRMFSRELWRKILSGNFSLTVSMRSLLAFWRQRQASDDVAAGNLQTRLVQAMSDFEGDIAVIAAANDLTAHTFVDWFSTEKQSDRTLSSIPIHTIAGADHTFSTRLQRQQLLHTSLDLLRRFRA